MRRKHPVTPSNTSDTTSDEDIAITSAKDRRFLNIRVDVAAVATTIVGAALLGAFGFAWDANSSITELKTQLKTQLVPLQEANLPVRVAVMESQMTNANNKLDKLLDAQNITRPEPVQPILPKTTPIDSFNLPN
jgi:hypothetical protein